MELHQAKQIADHWKQLLAPACTRIEIAGSIRRMKPEVKDIDLVLIPRVETVADLFGFPGTQINHLESLLPQIVIAQSGVTVMNGPKHKKVRLQEGLTLELWIVTPPAEFGAIMVLRTGPEDFSHWIVTARHIGGGLPSWLREKDGALWRKDRKIETPEETDFFKAVQMDYVEPEKRRAQWMRVRS